MAKLKFKDWKPKSREVITILVRANEIIEEYQKQNFTLSVRQLYYQLVSRDIIPNKQREYSRLVRILKDGRMGGFLDWDAIEDRNREIVKNPHWEKPADIIKTAASQFKIDKWATQPHRVIVMVEKDALSGVLAPICRQEDVEFSANKGYASISHLFEIAQKIYQWGEEDQDTVILYFGDFDPSGLDMDRDIEDRINIFSDNFGLRVVNRLALTVDQINEHNPPPNPAKLTDSRATAYIEKFGYSSWELDALRPEILADICRKEIRSWRDDEAYQIEKEREAEMRKSILEYGEAWYGDDWLEDEEED